MAKKEKKVWMVRTLGWSGKPSTTVQNGITIYRPGTWFGWQDFKAFDDGREADEWLCELCRTKGCLMEDFTIVCRKA